jgi:hypothetical protein
MRMVYGTKAEEKTTTLMKSMDADDNGTCPCSVYIVPIWSRAPAGALLCAGLIEWKEFNERIHRNRTILFPVFNVQRQLRKAVLGESYWETQACQRARPAFSEHAPSLCDGGRLSCTNYVFWRRACSALRAVNWPPRLDVPRETRLPDFPLFPSIARSDQRACGAHVWVQLWSKY